jgi:hypothetical protein
VQKLSGQSRPVVYIPFDHSSLLLPSKWYATLSMNRASIIGASSREIENAHCYFSMGSLFFSLKMWLLHCILQQNGMACRNHALA